MSNLSQISTTDRQRRQRLKDDLTHYAAKCLKIKTKSGGLVPFELNEVQKHINARLEDQRQRTGKVRALICKGRQQGCSTLIAGRFYWRASHRFGCRVFILTHSQDGTDHLFGMVERYHEHCPAVVRPHTGKSNAKELAFDLLDSDYQVGTAGARAVGRSQTVQLFHGSEVAFWPHADEHAAGVLQTVPDAPGTEVILESTANGLGNYFQQQWARAESGQSEFEAIFVPWFMTAEYAKATDRLNLSSADHEYQDAHGLTDEQMAWRQNKITELGHSWLFSQEYPATAQEAFQASGEGCFIRPELVVKARRHPAAGITGPLVIGVDPARGGGDRCGIISREGRIAGRLVCERLDTSDLMVIVARVVKLIEEHKPKLVCIDTTGLGAGVYDRLKELGHVGYGKPCKSVNFAQEAAMPARYLNKRAEMWDVMRDWFEEPAGVNIPDLDTLQSDLCAPIWADGGTRFDSSGRLVLEKKDSIRARMGSSPDLGDALALTFAFPIAMPVPRPQSAPRATQPQGWLAT